MGCDIHCYIEYKKPGARWLAFGRRINPGRNYWMFGFLAGVRLEVTPPVPPRGLPDDLAYAASDDSRLYISDRKDADTGDGCCTRESAERWVGEGSSQYIPNHTGKNTWVTHPDWHTASWLTAEEWENALRLYLQQAGILIDLPRLHNRADYAVAVGEPVEDSALQYITEYWAILQCIRCFEMQGCEARVVFWFDN